METRTVTLNWNPEGTAVADIFRNKTMRTVWLLFKCGHIVNQYFNDEVRALAPLIEGLQIVNEEKLTTLFFHFGWGSAGRHFEGAHMPAFVRDLLPYLIGEKELVVEVVE